jgi:predicted unusual protein kinase regulating ubiquinone biosynthesis (AarF/ABC1/UbiB family)
VRNRIGQALWDFYDFQIHTLKTVHADPHPGNFMMQDDGTLGIIDFGCVKVIPEDFYARYFILLNPDLFSDEQRTRKVFYELEFIVPEDTPEEIKFFSGIFQTMISLLGRPFHFDTFDFSDDAYFQEIYAFSDELSKIKELRESKSARGSQHSLYINRTYFGLYSILNELKAEVVTRKPEWLTAGYQKVG